jgi:hypothetical protein
VTLTLIAEVLAGEARISPGGPVDTDTACGLEPFTWDHWLEQRSEAADVVDKPSAELTGSRAVSPAAALTAS